MDNCYTMNRNLLNYLAKLIEFEIVTIPIIYPLNNADAFIEPLKETLKKYGNKIKFANFDHISSLPASIIPIKKLIEICHENSIIVLVDGAHALGQIEVDITDIGADFYVSNCHKWMYSPKGSAMLCVDKKWHSIIRPSVISSRGEFLHDDNWYKNFNYIGTRDYCNFLALKEALEFRNELGDKNIKKSK